MVRLVRTLVIAAAASALTAGAASARYVYVTFDSPSATGSTFAEGINDAGNVVGSSEDAGGTHAFYKSGVVWTEYPVAPSGASSFADAINDAGVTAGSYTSPSGLRPYYGDPSVSITAYIEPDGDFGAVATGVSKSGQLVGEYFNLTGSHGYTGTIGHFTTVSVPGATGVTTAYGINDKQGIVGNFIDGSGQHGFIGPVGSFVPFDVPGSSKTLGFGVNDRGRVTGWFTDGSGDHGFTMMGGVYVTLDVPGAVATYAQGINDKGQVVGYFDQGGFSHGFVATPVPEPGAWGLLLLGVAGMGVGLRRRMAIA
jgi:probable HAF family extracellular repeat protein